jgi:L-rhamnose mutarotase
MQYSCCILQLKQDRIDDYMAAHRVWPELLQVMHDAGIRNYSLFVANDGTVVEYFEAEYPEEAMRRVAQTDVSRRWEAFVAQYFETESTAEAGDVRRLKQFFHMA